MRIPTVRGVIDRRILINYRVDLAALTKLCPSPFRPLSVNGFGLAGICLIRLREIRPKFLPRFVGISSENAAHRFAVQWDSKHGMQTGVYIPRRDTSSWVNAFAGGRVFPGVHHQSHFDVKETEEVFQVEMTNRDGEAYLKIVGEKTDVFPQDSIFESLEQCSKFYQAGSVGYSPANVDKQYDGLELKTHRWQVTPLAVSESESSYFSNETLFPAGSAVLDNALLMQGIEHDWNSRQTLCCRS